MSDHDTSALKEWMIAKDYDPNEHLMKIERYDKRAQRKVADEYLNVQNRLIWFIRDQRALIIAGHAKCAYVIQTDLVEMDRERGWAHYKTFIRDVMGNEVTMYGSEAASDFPDYAEKASTKSLGRALLLLGYGTAFAPELDEGERIVDSPVAQQNASQTRQDDQQTARVSATTSQPHEETGGARDIPPQPWQSISAYLNRRGYTSQAAKENAMRAAGLPIKSGSAMYSAQEQTTLAAYVRAHPAKVPA